MSTISDISPYLCHVVKTWRKALNVARFTRFRNVNAFLEARNARKRGNRVNPSLR